jgi:hypothetical protein
MTSVIKKLMRFQEHHESRDENITIRLRKRKVPRRGAYLSDAIRDEFSSDEDPNIAAQVSKELGPSGLKWGSWIWHLAANTGRTSLKIYYSLGKYLGSLFGISAPGYQYEINEEARIRAEEYWKNKTDNFCMYRYTGRNIK